MWIIAGLGNPGSRYTGTRHNIGFDVVDALSSGTKFQERSGNLILTAQLGNSEVLLVKPQQFMNLSGQAIQPLVSFYKVPGDRLIVIHDELDLDLGQVRQKFGGGIAGHNGLRDLVARLGPDFHRIRVGIGHPRRFAEGEFRGSVADYVLARPNAEERAILATSVTQSVLLIEQILSK